MKRRVSRIAAFTAAVGAASVAVLMFNLPLYAQTTPAPVPGGMQVTTPYPRVSLEAGKTGTFNIEVRTSVKRPVELAVIQAPPGWSAVLRGGGFTVNGVTGSPDVPPTVQLEVKVPPDAAKGEYHIIVRAASAGLIQDLDMTVFVADVTGGAVSLTAEFSSLKAASDKTFNYSVTLKNDTPTKTNFSLAAQGPEGWQVTAKPSASEQAATIAVDAAGTGTITVEADPPDDVTAGKYNVTMTAEGGGQRAEIPLVAEVTGSFAVELTTPTGRLNADAVAGKTNDFTMRVRNTGTTRITNVRVSATAPTGWRVTMSPSTVRSIAAKKNANVIARITPSDDAVAGDYVVSFSATGEGTNDEAQVRVTVKASRLTGLVGLVLIAAAVYILFSFYRQYGRR